MQRRIKRKSKSYYDRVPKDSHTSLKQYYIENCILSVDPGLEGTGWAVWDPTHSKKVPKDLGVLNIRTHTDSGDLEWFQKAILYARSIRALSKYHLVHKVYCEYPAFHNTAGGQMVAGRGDLLKLTYLVGVMAGVLFPTRFILVPVREWKGTMPKDVVEARIRRHFEKYPNLLSRIKTHAWDAVGIGLHAKKVIW